MNGMVIVHANALLGYSGKYIMCTDGQGGVTSASKCQVHIQDHTRLIKKLSLGEKKLTGCIRLDEDLLPTANFTKWHS